VIMGGGFSAWDHNATILQLLEDTESGVLETRVVHSCRFRISLLKLSRAAFALGDLTSSGLSGSWGSKAVSQVLPLGVKSYLDAKKAAKAIQLDKGELTREAFLDMVGKKFGYLHLPTEHVDEMFSCMDVDNSGTVSVTEFISYIMANTHDDLVHQLNEGNLLGYEELSTLPPVRRGALRADGGGPRTLPAAADLGRGGTGALPGQGPGRADVADLLLFGKARSADV